MRFQPCFRARDGLTYSIEERGARAFRFRTCGWWSKLWPLFLDPYYNTALNIWGTQQGTIILTTTYVGLQMLGFMLTSCKPLEPCSR